MTEFEKDVEFNDKYFPRVDIKNREKYSPLFKFRNKVFVYDKKNSLVINVFQDEEEIEEWGKTKTPWREMEAVGLSRENWEDKEAREEYLEEYCDEIEEEDAYLIADAQREFGLSENLNEGYIKDELNPVLWENEELKPEIKEKILEVVEEFSNNLDFELKIKDIELVGSNASYNYTDKSDVDVHIITDFSDYGKPEEIVEALMNAVKVNFNKSYKIDFKGYNVEIYVQDINSSPTSNGVYSIMRDAWIKKPIKIEEPEVDLEPELSEYRKTIDTILKGNDAQAVEDMIDELYILRRDSLIAYGEFGKGNLIFKQIRNDGLLDGLKNKRVTLRSEELSLENFKK